MSNNFFNQEDDDSEFRDIPDEVGGMDSEVPNVRVNRSIQQSAPVQQYVQEEYEETYVEEAPQEEQEEDFSAVLNDARFRLEQGRLYEMIMNHDIFSGSEADEKVVKYVTKQIRNFAKEQMEIMLGMRSEVAKASPQGIVNFPFNDMEVQILKALASTASKGASAKPEAQSFSVAQTPPKKMGLNTINASVAKKTNAPATAKPQPTNKPLTQKPAAPVARSPKKAHNEAEIRQICMELGISREEYDRQYASFNSALSKPIEQMTEQEIIERNKKITLKAATQVKSAQAIPMPSVEQEHMIYSQRAEAAASNPQMQSILAALHKVKR